MGHLLPAEPIVSLDAYLAAGGGRVVATCRDLGPGGVVSVIKDSGLRGRGGAGFPTGIKWAGAADEEADRKFVVCNAAEGEPGTFKDRTLLRRNPYQVLEGIAAAAFAVGAEAAFIGIKAKFTIESARIAMAAGEMAEAGLLGDVPMTIVPGPDDYLFGEEKALLEVIEGRDPLPRLFPPYAQGLFEEVGGALQPAVVNNVETMANVAHIVVQGPEWFRTMGTDDSPGSMVCTIGGDVAVEAVAEVEMGTPLRRLIDDIGGGTASGRPVKMVLNGVSNRPLRSDALDAPISFEGLKQAGSGLGSASFTVFDDTVCAVAVAAAASAFLYRGSCGQCPPCKMGTAAITERLAALVLGSGDVQDVGEIAAWNLRVTDANRCGLGAGQRAISEGLLERFSEDVAMHVDRASCPLDHKVRVATIDAWDETRGVFTYARTLLQDAPGS